MLDDVVGLPWATERRHRALRHDPGSAGHPAPHRSVQVQPRSDCCFDQRVQELRRRRLHDRVRRRRTSPRCSPRPRRTTARSRRSRCRPGTDGEVRPLPAALRAELVLQHLHLEVQGALHRRAARAPSPSRTSRPTRSRYEWTFGDGGTSTDANPTHTYAAVGTYTVTLVARSADGRTSVVSPAVRGARPDGRLRGRAREHPVPGRAGRRSRSTSPVPDRAPAGRGHGASVTARTSDARPTCCTPTPPPATTRSRSPSPTPRASADTATRDRDGRRPAPTAPPRALLQPAQPAARTSPARGGRERSTASRASTAPSTRRRPRLDADPEQLLLGDAERVHRRTAGSRSTSPGPVLDVDRVRIAGDGGTRAGQGLQGLGLDHGHRGRATSPRCSAAHEPEQRPRCTSTCFPAPVAARYVTRPRAQQLGHTPAASPSSSFDVLTGPRDVDGPQPRPRARRARPSTASRASTARATRRDADRRTRPTTLLGVAERRHELVDQDRPRGRQRAAARPHPHAAPAGSDQRVRDYRGRGVGRRAPSEQRLHARASRARLPNNETSRSTCSSITRVPAKYVLLPRLVNNRGSGVLRLRTGSSRPSPARRTGARSASSNLSCGADVVRLGLRRRHHEHRAPSRRTRSPDRGRTP